MGRMLLHIMLGGVSGFAVLPNIHCATVAFCGVGLSNIMSKVEYRLVSQCQKHQCVWCVNDATQEAVQREGNLTAISRCCDDPKCRWLSAEMCESTVRAA